MSHDLKRLERTARTLSRHARGAKRLPHLILVTDPKRTPDPVALAERLPKGAAIVYRPFGAPNAARTARQLAGIARKRGLTLLIGADAVRAPGAGVHLPERLAHRAGPIKRTRPGALVTCAAHSLGAALKAKRAGADAVLASTVFESKSPSAKAPLGAVRFAALVRQAGLPVYPLGGIKTTNAPRLLGSGAAGLAMVEGLAKALRT